MPRSSETWKMSKLTFSVIMNSPCVIIQRAIVTYTRCKHVPLCVYFIRCPKRSTRLLKRE